MHKPNALLALVFMAAAIPTLASGQSAAIQANDHPLYLDPTRPLEQRVDDLISRMTLDEKVSQMMNSAPGIPRLGIPPYNWWNEALHGVARAGVATVFPQAIGLGATWDPDLLHDVATAISDEARAKYHEAIRQNRHGIYYGLTFWSPNINIFRDPRWGRGQETYGEDPYLTGRMAVAFVRGMQGNDPRYLKVVATLKHYAVHSGPESERHRFDARIDERDLRETYLAAFRAGITEGKAASVMCAYNALDGEPLCADKRLLTDILRGEWGMDGYIVSDCGAIGDIHGGHAFAKSAAAASALAVRAGCDLECGGDYHALPEAIRLGLISEAEVDVAVRRLFTARFRLGMFDPQEMVPYSKIPFSVNDSPAHRELARRAARESMVLLKNDRNILPLRPNVKSVAVIGPNADSLDVLLGNYNGTPSRWVTPLQGIRQKLGPAGKVVYARGCNLTRSDPKLLSEAVNAARSADVAIVMLGLSPRLEGEEMRVNAAGFSGGDRTSLDLPAPQDELLKALVATGKPVVLVLMNGSAVAVNWAADHVPAIVEAWYPGEEGGAALVDVLWGDYNPSGRLPVTFYRSASDLPPFDQYQMKGRTYRYFSGTPLFPFGYGLSYSRFSYGRPTLENRTARTGQEIKFRTTVQNNGSREGDEVIQCYVSQRNAPAPTPIRSLAGIRHVHLAPGQRMTVRFSISPRQLSIINDAGKRMEMAGDFMVSIGGKQPGFRGRADAFTTGATTRPFRVTGPAFLLAP